MEEGDAGAICRGRNGETARPASPHKETGWQGSRWAGVGWLVPINRIDDTIPLQLPRSCLSMSTVFDGRLAISDHAS